MGKTCNFCKKANHYQSVCRQALKAAQENTQMPNRDSRLSAGYHQWICTTRKAMCLLRLRLEIVGFHLENIEMALVCDVY